MNYRSMNTKNLIAATLILAFGANAWPTDLSTVPLSTYFAPSSIDVKPNILFVLDDSGSMDWSYMPDAAGSTPANYTSRPDYLARNSAFNGVAYNPAVRYLPPIAANSDGTNNLTTYPSMTGTSAATGADTGFALPNWRAVKNDGFGIQSTSNSNLVDNAYYYTTITGEYCSTPSLRSCTTSSAATGSYTYPSYMRWCTSSALSTCKATYDSDAGYTYPRIPAPRVATIDISGSNSTSVSSIKVDGLEILSATTAASTTASTVASRIVSAINTCSKAKSGNCTTAGYVAYVTGGSSTTVTILAPGNTSATPSITQSGTMTLSTSSFARVSNPPDPFWDGSSRASAVPGENYRVVISSSYSNSYPYPGSTEKATGRTDCAGTTCTYQEEMTNYANWWAYYHTRMQMMKTSVSRAFSGLDTAANITAGVSRFRIGYMSINNNTGSDFVNLDEFKGAHRYTWYQKLFAANPDNSTPLRAALSKAGRLYAGKYNGSTLNGVTVVDPMQWSCQRNYTILSTDGFWNSGSGYKLDGSTALGNQDGALPAPYNDGGVAVLQERTSTLQTRTTTQRAEKGTLQTRTTQLQTQTQQLQQRTVGSTNTGAANLVTRTSSNSGATWTNWTTAASCDPDNSGGNRRQCAYFQGGWSNTATCTPSSTLACGYSGTWSAWSGTQTCTAHALDSSGTAGGAWQNGIQCQNVGITAWSDAASCSVTSPDASGNFTDCQYAWAASAATQTCSPTYVANDYANATVYRNCTTSNSAWSNAANCTATTVWSATGTKTQCQYTSWSSWVTVASCTPEDQSVDPNYTVATAKQCQTTSVSGGVSNTLADVAAYYYNTDLRSATATGVDTTGTCTGPIIAPNTTANNLCTNNYEPSGRDTASWQHMTTFTLGLGAQGKMLFSPTYWTDQPATLSDFYAVKTGTSADPANGVCSWLSSGSTCVWPTPSSDNIANIDDLWHAAVNGRGDYFSATDPSSLSTGLSNTLAKIVDTPRPGTSAAAASSNPNISAGDNYVFSSYYKSVDWYGDLYRQRFDITTKALSTNIDWSAKALLDCATTPWTASKAYIAGAGYRQGSTCYLVTTDYVSGTSFGSTDTANAAVVAHSPSTCSATAWAANTSYTVGTTFTNASNCYYVITAYTSGSSFGTADTLNTNASYVSGTPTSRTIYTRGSSGLINFQWDQLTTAQQAYFGTSTLTYTAGSPSTGLSQFCASGASCLSSTAQNNTTVATGGAAGEALINYLRGDRTNEGTFFRERKHVLGDIVSSEARYVKAPLFNYTDAGYSDYKQSKATRTGAVYVAANDGMLHSFDAETGKELWGYIPSMVLPELYRLADLNYSSNHQYFVDGTPETGDICPTAPTTACTGAQWKTILVGGLNRGGKGYYALDVTDPANPVSLWEFTNSTLGYTFGNPRITKLKTGQWVVLLTSGYNNADGIGRLYVLDAYTGSLIRTISTGAGTASTPSGLAKIAAHSPTADTNNTTTAAYGGDTLGNLWRFDINGDIGASGYDAQLLVSFVDAGGTRQPITAKPIVTTISGYPVVYVGTGEYLGIGDITNTQYQTMYAVKDNLGATTYGNPRVSTNNFVQQTMVESTCTALEGSACTLGEKIRKITSAASVNWSSNNGWYVDLLTAGERLNTDPALALGTLAFTSNTPNNASAQPCGEDTSDTSASWFYFVDYLTGGPVTGSNGVIGVSLGNVIATRPVLIRLPDGTVLALIRTSGGSSSGGSGGGGTATEGYYPGKKEDGGTPVEEPKIKPGGGSARRVSWREITTN